MTDESKRQDTIVPPPDNGGATDSSPPDREKITIPPLPTDPGPPEDFLQLSEAVFERLGNIEDGINAINRTISEKFGKLDELHALLFGTPTVSGGKPRKNIVTALHALSGNVGVAGANAEFVAEQQKNLPQLVAQEVANRLVAMYQAEMRALHEADNAALDRIKGLEQRIAELVTSPNGSGKSK